MNRPLNSAASSELRCLLCGGDRLGTVWSLTGADVRVLWQTLGHDFSEPALGALTPEREVAQVECRACGFRFFDPSLAGGGKFYEELARAGYYVTSRPEFDFALDLCRRAGAKSVLDVGGGDGAFLDHARGAGLTTVFWRILTSNHYDQ